MKEVIVMHEIFEDCSLIKVCNCREKMERERAETIERNFNSHQTMDLLYPQNKQCMYTDFILPFAQDYWIWLLI